MMDKKNKTTLNDAIGKYKLKGENFMDTNGMRRKLFFIYYDKRERKGRKLSLQWRKMEEIEHFYDDAI
jgi:hypothetical protein